MRWYEKLFFACVAVTLFYSASANAQIEGAKNLGKSMGNSMDKTAGAMDGGKSAAAPKKSRNGFKPYKPNYKTHKMIGPKKMKKPEHKKPEYKKPSASQKSSAQ